MRDDCQRQQLFLAQRAARRGLKTVMKGMKRGKDVCGVDEDGKDCYMYTSDSLRDDILYAIQTKKGDVKMSSSAADNVANILTQLRTALTTPVKDAKKHKKAYPDLGADLIATRARPGALEIPCEGRTRNAIWPEHSTFAADA